MSKKRKSKEFLVVKKKKNDNFHVRVKDRVTHGYNETNYDNTINIRDYRQLALFLDDMRILFNAPIDRAYNEMKNKKSPFW